MDQIILKMSHISKAFGGAKALDDVSLTVKAGEVHALLGENGAGKSTLMNILTGVLPADQGEILFEGTHYHHPSIMQMERAGIAFVHQELNVINDLTVFENIFLNREICSRWHALNKKEMIRKTQKLFEDLGVEMDPMSEVRDLKTGEKQLLEICRALYMDARLIILDEPTTALSNSEIEHLFSILKRLKEKGKSFIFISHKMPEIFELTDAYTVFRNGRFVSTGRTAETTAHALALMMVGEKYADEELYLPRPLGEKVVELNCLSGQGFKNVDLSIREGEIVAFTGLQGCGASELMQTMFGALPVESGSIQLFGKSVHGRILDFMKNHIAMLPANRKENSVIPDMNILENMGVAKHQLTGRKPVIHWKEEREAYSEYRQMLQIKAESEENNIGSLSGGNQQKVFFARWLNTGAKVLLFDNPTQGVDVGTKEEIYKLILKFAGEGKTILINTLEIPEIKKVSDRCIVFYDGQIVKTLSHEEIDEKTVMLYATNAVSEKEAG